MCKCFPSLISWKVDSIGMVSSFENRILDCWVANRNIDEMMDVLKDYRVCLEPRAMAGTF